MKIYFDLFSDDDTDSSTSVVLTERKLDKKAFPVDNIKAAQLFFTNMPIVAWNEEWNEVLATYEDGNTIVVYLTHHGADVAERGPMMKSNWSRSKQLKAAVKSMFYEFGVSEVTFR